MTKLVPWQEEANGPSDDEARVYTYIPRTGQVPASDCPSSPHGLSMHGTYPSYYAPVYVQPAYPSQAYCHPRHCYDEYSSYQQQVPAQSHYAYYPRSYFYCDAPQTVFHQPTARHPRYPQHDSHGVLYPSDAYITTVPVDQKYLHGRRRKSGKTLNDGTLAYYGRTAQEVQHDAWHEQRYHEREAKKTDKAKAIKSEDDAEQSTAKSKAKNLEPGGKATDKYWVVHTDGGMRAYPLGTIKANFQGEWKIDRNGWPYLAED